MVCDERCYGVVAAMSSFWLRCLLLLRCLLCSGAHTDTKVYHQQTINQRRALLGPISSLGSEFKNRSEIDFRARKNHFGFVDTFESRFFCFEIRFRSETMAGVGAPTKRLHAALRASIIVFRAVFRVFIFFISYAR